MKQGEPGHSPGTATAEPVAAQRRRRGQRDGESLPSWPRLLTLDQAARYLGLGFWTVRELINSGRIPVTRIERPRTPSALRRQPIGDTMRMIRLDRADLDAFVNACARERLAPESNR